MNIKSSGPDIQNLSNDNGWLALLPESLPILVAYVDAERKHRYVNKPYADWFSKKPEEILNKSLKELTHDPASYAVVEGYESRALAGENVNFVIRLPEPQQGEIDSFNSNFIPHRDKKTGQVLGMISISQSMTQHERVIKEKESSEKRFRDLTNTIPQLLWTSKSDGTVDYVNERYLEYTGKSEKFFEKEQAENLHPDDKERVISSWVSSMSSGTAFKEEYRLRGANGAYRWFLGHAVPIKSASGSIQYWIGTATDIEVERCRAIELEKAKTAAEDANRAKSAFLANMSHELRTPLSAVLGFSALLKNENLSADEREQFIDVIERNGKMLTRIIDDLLDLSRLEAGRIVVDQVKFSPKDLLSDILNMFRDRASEKQIQMHLSVGADVPAEVISDPVRLRQILINLVGNAIKFTDQGRVTIQLSSQEESTRTVRLMFEVKDTGCGFTDTQLQQIFVPFYQADATTSRRHGGAGLGLPISYRLAGALGGDIKVTQYGPGQGSTFLLTISAQRVAGQDRALAGGKVGEGALGANPILGAKCLVVDDAIDNQYLTKYLLESIGGMVDVANSGPEALQQLQKNVYDIVFLDIQMPGMDGYETLKHLRAKGYKMPVIALTAHAMSSEIQRSQAAGFSYHLTKPINFEELTAVTSKLIHQRAP